MTTSDLLSSPQGGFSKPTATMPLTLLTRIRNAYRVSVSKVDGGQSPLWSSIADKSRALHDALLGTDIQNLSTMLHNPGSNYLFYGFENLFLEEVQSLYSSQDIQQARIAQIVGGLLILATALGARRQLNLEFGADYPNFHKPEFTTISDVVSHIEERIGGPVDFPNPFPDEHGLITTKGILSHRAYHALYYASRVKTMSERYGNNILEIGAGLGRTAYFCYRFGLTQYDIIDLPMANVAQACFLGLTLGEDAITLAGEERKPGTIRIVTPDQLTATGKRFNVVLNTDSMTEMTRDASTRYADFIANHSDVFLSINHEANDFLVHDLIPLKHRLISRAPYWLRTGYIEEIFFNERPAAETTRPFLNRVASTVKNAFK